MRALRILSGIAVLLTALHFAHAIQHFVSMQPARRAGLWAAVAAAILIDILTFAGGCLLLRSAR